MGALLVPPFTIPERFAILPPTSDNFWPIVDQETGEFAYVGGPYLQLSAATWQQLADFEVMRLKWVAAREYQIKEE